MANADLIVRIRADATEAQAALRQVGAGLQGIETRGMAMGRSMGAARADVGNLAAQFQDVAVMLQSGQSPLTLAIQQGTQIGAVLGAGGGGAAGAVKALGAAFASIISPVNLLSIATLAVGATVFQMFSGSREEAETVEEAVDRITGSVKGYADALREARTPLHELRLEHGRWAEDVQANLIAEAAARGREASAATGQLVDTMTAPEGGAPWTELSDTGAAERAGRHFGLNELTGSINSSVRRAARTLRAEYVAALDAMAASATQSFEAQRVAAEAVVEVQERAANFGGRGPEDDAIIAPFRDHLGNVREVIKEHENLNRFLADPSAQARLNALAAQALDNLKERQEREASLDEQIEGIVEKRERDAQAAEDTLEALRDQAGLAAIVLHHGEDSLEAAQERLRQEQASRREETLRGDLAEDMRVDLEAMLSSVEAAEHVKLSDEFRLAANEAERMAEAVRHTAVWAATEGERGRGRTLRRIAEMPEPGSIPGGLPRDTVTPAPGQIVVVVDAGSGFTEVRLADGSVQRREGTRAWRNNNPGNIEFGPFAERQGAVGTDGRFAVFPTLEDGRRAMQALLFESGSYAGKTIAEAIARYAPPSENNTGQYASIAAQAAGVSIATPMSALSEDQRRAMILAMERHEGFRPGRVNGIAAEGVSAPALDLALSDQATAAREAENEAEQERNRIAREAATEAERALELREDLVEASRRATSDAEFEATLIGKTAGETARLRAEYILLNQARAAGIDLNELVAGTEETVGDMIARTAASVGAGTVEQERRTEVQAQAVERLNASISLGRDVFGGLISDMRQGATVGEMFANVLGSVADRLADMALDNLFGTAKAPGPWANIFGLLTGGLSGSAAPANIPIPPSRPMGLAIGGAVWPNMPVMVGEMGPELLMPRNAGMVIPNHRLPSFETAAASAMGSGALRPFVDMRVFTEPGTVAQIARAEAVNVTHEATPAIQHGAVAKAGRAMERTKTFGNRR